MTAARPLKIGLVQMAMGEEPTPNLAKAIDGVRDAAKRGAQLIVLPELFRSRYFCQSEDAAQFALAEAIPGPSTEALGKLAAELKVTLVASLFEKRAAGLYHNTAAVIDAERGYLGKYRKMHIPDDPRYYEKYYFAPGDLGFKVFETKPVQLGVLVCWDQWYPEAARLTAMQAPRYSFTRRRSVGTRKRRRSTASGNTGRGRRFNAVTRSRTAASSSP
jgi:N-carbamoylputrescine amidase